MTTAATPNNIAMAPIVEFIRHGSRRVDPVPAIFLRPRDVGSLVQLVPGLDVYPRGPEVHQQAPFLPVPGEVAHLVKRGC